MAALENSRARIMYAHNINPEATCFIANGAIPKLGKSGPAGPARPISSRSSIFHPRPTLQVSAAPNELVIMGAGLIKVRCRPNQAGESAGTGARRLLVKTKKQARSLGAGE